MKTNSRKSLDCLLGALLALGMLELGADCVGAEDNKVIAEFVAALDNLSVRYATERPPGSPFPSLGREIVILTPSSDAVKAYDPDSLITALIRCLDNTNQDWAANLILYSLTGRDAMLLSGFEKNQEEWRQKQKDSDRRYWNAWWKESHGRLVWSGSRLEVPQKRP